MSAKIPEHTITLTREVNAAAQDVYAAWTEPEKMKRWLGKVSAEVRIGGHYRWESQDENGKTYIYAGEYLVLEKGKHLVQSLPVRLIPREKYILSTTECGIQAL